MTVAEIMADSGHYSIDSTTVRAHVSAAGGKGGLIDEILAARLLTDGWRSGGLQGV